jgi:hypothetical protein
MSSRWPRGVRRTPSLPLFRLIVSMACIATFTQASCAYVVKLRMLAMQIERPVPRPLAAASDRVGLNISNIYYDGATVLTPNEVSALAQSGASWVRVNLLWGWTVEAKKDSFNWTGLDSSIRTLRAAHINILMILDGPVPCWALPNQASSTTPPCMAPEMTIPSVSAWQTFVATAVKRYGSEVTYWEIWNEPDLSSSISGPGISDANRLALYRDNILIPGAEAVHATNPNDKVVAPALSVNYPLTAPEPNMTRALETVLDRGAAHDVDVVSLHIYSQFDLISYGNTARAAMRNVGLANAPLWLTETGILEPSTASGSLSRAASVSQENYVLKQFSAALESGVYDKMFWFALTDSGDVSGHHADSYGLIDNSDYKTYRWSPRPAYRALQKLLKGGP